MENYNNFIIYWHSLKHFCSGTLCSLNEFLQQHGYCRNQHLQTHQYDLTIRSDLRITFRSPNFWLMRGPLVIAL